MSALGRTLIFLAILSVTATAQSTTQSIQGLVTDTSGAMVPGARVTCTNADTGVSGTVVTNETGNYSFSLLPVGDYEVTVELESFKTGVASGLRLETAAQLRQDFTLELGSVTETIEVTAPAVLLNTENATTGGVIENKRVTELPLNGRNMVQLAVLVPGVQFGRITGLASGLDSGVIPGHGFSVSANGQRELHQVVSLDGVDARDPKFHGTSFVPSIESIEEFKVQTSAYSAEYGFGGGAQVTITTRSGTNDIHGTLFWFLRNDAFDAEHYFLNFERPPGVERAEKDRLRRNQFGSVVSGPIIKNKSFWALNWETRRERVELVNTQWFPLDEFREGNFSELLTGTMNPDTGRLFRAPILLFDPFSGDAFPGNIIPKSRLHPGSLNLLNQFVPRADFRQADPLDFTARKGVNQPIDVNTYFGRVDHYFGEADRVFGRISLDRSGRKGNHINPNLSVTLDSDVTNLATQWVHTFRRSMINELRVGFNVSRLEWFHARTHDESFDIDALGIGEFRVAGDGNRKLTPSEQGIPRFNGLGFDLSDLNALHRPSSTIQVGDHLSLIQGRHNLKFGAELHHITIEEGGGNIPAGRLDFGLNESGHGFASFLLGVPAATRTPEGSPLTFARVTRLGAYIHDDWKATRNLTMNMGLRFDFNGVPIDTKGLWRTLDFVGEGAAVGRGQGFLKPDGTRIPTIFPEHVDERGAVRLYQRDLKFFMPRVGIAYRPGDKWVVRIGAGWYDNVAHLTTRTILKLMPPKSGSLLFANVTDPAGRLPLDGADGNTYQAQTRRFRSGFPILTLDDPFFQNTAGSAIKTPANLLHLKPDYKDGDVWKWSFDIQRELPFNTALTVGYAGSKGSHTGNSIHNFNDAPPSPDSNFQARRPFQEFYDPATPELGVQRLGHIRFLDSFGNSFYHGLQVKLDRRFSNGFSFGLAYAFSKAHGDGEAGGNEGGTSQNPRDRLSYRGRFRFDQTHNMVLHYVWELPGSGLTGVWRHLFGGWQSNGILSVRSGFPFGVTQNARDLNVGRGPVRPDRIADGALENPTRKLWFDPSAFRRVSCNIPGRLDLCRYGNTGVNILDSPGQRNLDFSLYKNVPIAESISLQFRAEFFNAFNTPYFGEPIGIGFSSIDTIVPDAPRQGEIRSLRTPMRIIQFGLKLFF